MKLIRWTKQQLTQVMNQTSRFVGHPVVFAVAVLVILGWFGLRIFLDYDVWFDIMDVAIFITTFLLLFVIQSSQNADTRAMQDKLDAILEALPNAKTGVEGEEKKFKKGKKDLD